MPSGKLYPVKFKFIFLVWLSEFAITAEKDTPVIVAGLFGDGVPIIVVLPIQLGAIKSVDKVFKIIGLELL